MPPKGIEPATPSFPDPSANQSAIDTVNDYFLKRLVYHLRLLPINAMNLIMIWFVHTKFCKQ